VGNYSRKERNEKKIITGILI